MASAQLQNTDGKKMKFGVAFSGGGYRATTYHIGTIQALKELKVLDKVDVLATNSGGSITGAFYALHVGKKSTEEIIAGLKKGLRGNVIASAISHPRCILGLFILLVLIIGIGYFSFLLLPWYSLACLLILVLIILKFQFVVFPVSMGIRRAYNKFFFDGKTLSDLAVTPRLVMNATNMETGKLWSFSKEKMGDYTYRYELKPPALFTTENFPLARAVNASSCVPFAFNPVRIPKKYFHTKADVKRVSPFLVDGGIYDNQGIHKLIQDGSSFECDIVLVSDAGAGSGWKSNQRNAFSLLMRVTDIFMLRTKNMQMISGVFENTDQLQTQRQIGYFSLGMDVLETVPFFIGMFRKHQLTREVVAAHGLTGKEGQHEDVLEALVKKSINWDSLVGLIPSQQEWEIACKVSTNLVPLSEEQSAALIKHAHVMTIIFMRLYCPSVLVN